MAEYPHPSSAGRSANMRANRRTDTKPELALRRALHKLGYRFRKDYRLDLDSGRRVRPDIAFTARRVAVFVDGCFWHACPQHGSKPRANDWYWTPKLARNVERDRVADETLAAAGWQVVRIWELHPSIRLIRPSIRLPWTMIRLPRTACALTVRLTRFDHPHRIRGGHA